MARIAGVDLPREKRIEAALPFIFGVGPTRTQEILKATQIDPSTRVRNLTEDEVSKLREVIEKQYKVEGDLQREISMHIKRLSDISSYRGIRHRRGLPVRGQKTKNNARTRKGPRRTVGVRRKK